MAKTSARDKIRVPADLGLLPRPVFHPQPRHPGELADIVRYQGDAEGKGVGGDEGIQRVNRRTGFFKFRREEKKSAFSQTPENCF